MQCRQIHFRPDAELPARVYPFLLMLQPVIKTIFPVIILPALILLVWSIAPAAAHIEKGSMPDSVAEMEYRILLEFEPDNLEVRNQLGMVFYRLGRLAEAEDEFNLVLKKSPDNFDALDALGLINAKRANFQLAINLYKKAIAVNPDDMLVYYHLGQALEQLGDISGAAAAYRTGLSKNVSAAGEQAAAEQRQALIDAVKNIQNKAAKTEDHDS